MERQQHSNQGRFWCLLAAGGGCLTFGTVTLFLSGPLRENLLYGNGWGVILETAVLFLWMLFFCCCPMAGYVRLGGISLGILAGIWCHQAFLPFVVSGLWLFGILLMGDGILWGIRNTGKGAEQPAISWQQRLTSDFVLGAGSWISLVCLLSAFCIGGVSRIRAAAGAVTFLAAAWAGLRMVSGNGGLHGRMVFGVKGRHRRSGFRRRKESFLWSRAAFRQEGILLAVMLTMILIQLARVNLWPDYDSLHYGLRSPYILDTGRGIYEDLGNINLVYTYPKGFEILTFPLAGTATFGYVLCFNIWLTILVLILVYGLMRQLGASRRLGLTAAAMVSLIPGVMNMSITAKSDTVTLVCQLVILISAAGICVSRREGQSWFGTAAGSCFLSFAMKPTSVVFSTVTSLTCLAVLAGTRYASAASPSPHRNVWQASHGSKSDWRFPAAVVLFPAGAWAGTWIRTYRMTGVPTTSVFTSIWERLGFQVRWPYAFAAIPDQGLEMGMKEGVEFLLRRLFHILFSPTGEDMAHVIIAWGTSLMALFLLAWLMWGRRTLNRRKGREEGQAYACIHVTAVVIGLFSLLSVYLLWQVDGNYFMLLYVLLAVIGTFCMAEARPQEGSAAVRRIGAVVAAGFLLFQTAVTLSTDWSGSMGFTPVSWSHHGYYHHQQALYENACREGNQAIWSILSRDPSARVIAVGEHPQVLQFPCNVQSYYDVTGSGGNVRLVKTLDDFKQFLRFAGTEYLYVQAGYLEEGTRCYDVVRYLVEDGSLADIRYENGNMIACINLDGAYTVDPEQEAAEFYHNIKMKMP